MTFGKDALPPVDRSRGGFWSLSMYDKDYFMLPNSPNGRTNIGTVSLDANELQFAADGSLTITMSHEEPTDAAARTNWLPAPDSIRADRARLCADAIDSRRHVQTAERGAGKMKSIVEAFRWICNQAEKRETDRLMKVFPERTPTR